MKKVISDKKHILFHKIYNKKSGNFDKNYNISQGMKYVEKISFFHSSKTQNRNTKQGAINEYNIIEVYKKIKKKQNVIGKRMKFKKNIKFIYFLIITILFIQKIICIKFNLFSYRISQVILKIKGTGKKIILGEFFLEYICYPDEIRINGIISNEEINE